jgi:predicted dehydrogenase
VKALVIGYGSIGERHARILLELGCEVAVMSRREINFKPAYSKLSEALKNYKPQYVVIANRTSEHFETLQELIKTGFKGIVLIEKPLFEKNKPTMLVGFGEAYVGYNLRFHPLLKRIKELLNENIKIIQVQIYVGKYLPTWRPNQALANSASRAAGGGVLRDLSHELDYINWIFGPWEKLTALGGHFSHLEIDSDDAFSLMIKTKRCALVSLQMNYLDRIPERSIVIHTDDFTLKGNLMTGELQTNERIEKYSVERDFTYRKQHENILNKQFTELCSFEEGLEVMKMIEAAEESVSEEAWVAR